MPNDTMKSVDDNIKVQYLQLNTMQTQLELVKEFKASVAEQNDKLVSKFGNFGKSVSKSFSLKSLGSKIGDTFNKGIKGLTSPFRALGNKIGGAFSSIKSAIGNFAPVQMIKSLASKLNPMKIISKFRGKKGDEAKTAFFENWYDPAKVAIKQQKAIEKYWKKKLKKEEKKNKTSKEDKKLGLQGKRADQGQVMYAIVKAVNKIASAVAFFFEGPGLGIALAIGLVPPILILCAALVIVAYLICDTLKTLLSPLIEVVCDVIHWLMDILGPSIETILSSVANFLSMIIEKITAVYDIVFDTVINILKPIAAVIEVVSGTIIRIAELVNSILDGVFGTAVKIVGGVAGAIGGAIGSIFSDDEEEEKPTDPIEILNNISDTLFNIDASIKEGFSEFVSSLSNSILEFGNVLKDIYTSTIIPLLEKGIMLIKSFVSIIGSFGSKIFSSIGNVFSGIKSGLQQSLGQSSLFGKIKEGFKSNQAETTAAPANNIVERRNNPFETLISSFETMHKETIKMLDNIKQSLSVIEKNKIEIGSVNAVNNGETSDGKQANSLQNITVNTNIDLDKVLEKMTEANEKLENIVTNTSLTDEGTRITGSVWSI